MAYCVILGFSSKSKSWRRLLLGILFYNIDLRSASVWLKEGKCGVIRYGCRGLSLKGSLSFDKLS